jgi:hypothetical protein
MACGMYGAKRNIHRGWIGKSEGKKLFERHRCRWDDNIEWILKK